MAGNIKGITIEFRGDTTSLSKSLDTIQREARGTESELKRINSALKFNPTNTVLLSQKQQVLRERVDATVRKVNELKNVQKQLDAKGVDRNSEAYRRVQREIVIAQSQIKRFNAEIAKAKFARWNAGAEAIQKVGRKLTAITRPARIAAGALAGATIFKGFQRLQSLDQTKAELQQLGIRGQKLAKIMDQVSSSVDGTKFTLQDMAKVAKGAMGAGVTKQYSLDKYLGRTADLAALSGTNVDEMGALMNKAYSKGKVQAQLMNQLNARGIPIYKLLQKHLGVSADELEKMSREGKISFDDLYQATNKYDGLAKKLGTQTLPGAITVLGQQFGKVGGELLEGIYEPLKKVFGGLISYIKGLSKSGVFKEWGTAFGETMQYFIEWIGKGKASMDGLSGKAQGMVRGLSPIIKPIAAIVKGFMALPNAVKVAIGAFALFGGPVITGIGKIAGLIGTIGPKIMTFMLNFKAGVGIAGVLKAGFAALLGPVGAVVAAIGAVVAAIVVLYKKSASFRDNVNKLGAGIKKAFGEAAKQVLPALKTAFKAVGDALKAVWGAVKPLIELIARMLYPKLQAIVGVLRVVMPFLIKLAGGIITAIANAITVVSILIKGLFNLIKVVLKGINTAVKTATTWIINTVKNLGKTIPALFRAAWNGLGNIVKGAMTAVKNAITAPIAFIKGHFNRLRLALGQGWGNVVGAIKNAFNTVKNVITAPFKAAVGAVKGLIGKIKGFFSFKFKWPKIPLPHFTVKPKGWKVGDLVKGKIPSLGISWYAKGGIFDSASLIGVGEKGPEAVVPLDTLWKKLDAIADASTGGSTMVINVYGSDGMSVNELAEAVKRKIIQEENRRREAWA